METKKKKPITVKKASTFLSNKGLGLLFGPKFTELGNPWKKDEDYVTIEECMVEFSKDRNEYLLQQTTSQQQTIERLREGIKEAIHYLVTPEDQHGVAVGEIVLKLEQLLNTTEPIDQ